MTPGEMLQYFGPSLTVLAVFFRYAVKINIVQALQKKESETVRTEFKNGLDNIEIKYKSEISNIRENLKYVEKQDDLIMSELKTISQAIQKILTLDNEAQRTKEKFNEQATKMDLLVSKVDKLVTEFATIKGEWAAEK